MVRYFSARYCKWGCPLLNILEGTSRLIDLVQQYRASLIHHVVTGKRDVRQAAAALPNA